ncbi:MAG: hypothetical protein H8K06_09495 [Nitrospira sp.]|nr:hypothetical protein [Nitrospira sp.]
MTESLATPPSGFIAFLPKEYQGEFSRDWILGLSPFSDPTCRQCFTVQQWTWIGMGPRECEERDFTCEKRG